MIDDVAVVSSTASAFLSTLVQYEHLSKEDLLDVLLEQQADADLQTTKRYAALRAFENGVLHSTEDWAVLFS